MSLRARLQRLIPTRQQLESNRFTRWLAPWLGAPKLWHWSRRGVSMGIAVGIFFGLLVPIAQIPISAATAIVLRANIPAAMGSTLITNPVTFGPIYYLAYRTGLRLTGEHKSESQIAADMAVIEADLQANEDTPVTERPGPWQRIQALGKPLVLGLAVFAVIGGLLSYVLVSAAWYAHVLLKRRQRRRREALPRA
ncbi:MAG: DUF2062 domain-containing protein [Pseudomonadota bacterium]|nr:DUF2062 domain-containing protein [Pseudomonadota bacterium]